jgi:predicted lipid-binding transport protein (Tim44 family)
VTAESHENNDAPESQGQAGDAAPTGPALAQRAATVLGWISGASLGLMGSIALGASIGTAYPMVLGNFVGVVLGAFGGMALADRWGVRSLKPLAFATGVLTLLALILVLTVIGSPEP